MYISLTTASTVATAGAAAHLSGTPSAEPSPPLSRPSKQSSYMYKRNESINKGTQNSISFVSQFSLATRRTKLLKSQQEFASSS
jgi:hypothetical protein